MVLHKVKVAELWLETPTLTGVKLQTPEDAQRAHVSPGQVLAAQVSDGSPVYLALASKPQDKQFELLVNPHAAQQLKLEVGQELSCEGPMGPGFPFEEARGHDVLLFAVGSALAPIRPVIEMIRDDRSDFGRVNVYLGAMDAAAFPYQGAYDAWRRDRIDLTTVIHPEYVQNVFTQDPVPVDDAIAFVCGMPAMMDGVTEALGRFGLGSDRVFRNW